MKLLRKKAGRAGDASPDTRVCVGGWTDPRTGQLRFLWHSGPEHAAGIAPTRSGKGLALVITTLLAWRQSVVVYDPKGELWNLTAGWRQSSAGNRVIRFDPVSASGSACFNPLAEIRIGTIYEVGDVQNIVTILVDPDGKGLESHWAKTSHAFLTGLILHEGHKARRLGGFVTLPGIDAAMADPTREIDRLYEEMLKNAWLDGRAHPVVQAAARDMLDRDKEERSSVLSTAKSYLALYRDPLIAANVSRSDFMVGDLMNQDRPVTLYVQTRNEDKDRLKPLMRLIVNQLVRVLLRPELKFKSGRPVQPHRHKLLLLIDEFPSLGKLEVFKESLAYIAGYGIKAYLIMQDVAQLWEQYGHDETILSNCHIRLVYAPNKLETAEWISRQTGTTTVIKEEISTSGARFGAVLQNVSRTFHEVSRPLMTADEVARLKMPRKDGRDMIVEAGEMLVFISGHAPIRGTQSLYFLDPALLARTRLPPPDAPVPPAAIPTRMGMGVGIAWKS